MNKKFLTAAIAAALIAPTAALAEVTVYGKLHMSLDYADTNTAVAAGAVGNKANLGLSSNSSRIGFKGSEDLGGGMKAVWQIESRVDAEEGGSGDSYTTGGLATRNTYLGLAGEFGTFLVGKHDTPLKMVGRKFDVFGDTMADTRNLLGNSKAGGGVVGFDMRAPNVIAYITPNFSGFSAVLAYVTGAGNAGKDFDNNKFDAFSLNASYANGPLYVAGAYENHSKEIGQVLGTATGAGKNSASAWRLGASFKFGDATVGGMWEQLEDADYVDAKRSAGTLFGTYSFGSETVKLAYTAAGKWEKGGTDVANSDAALIAVGLDHKLSKRTKAYVQYAAMTNENGASYTIGGGGFGDKLGGVAAGKDPSAFSVGLIHKF
jgi:predicted porin